MRTWVETFSGKSLRVWLLRAVATTATVLVVCQSLVADEAQEPVATVEKTDEGRKPNEKAEPSQKLAPKRRTKQVIGATAELLELETGFIFKARVDTGAKTCSLHVEEWGIKDEVTHPNQRKEMKANIGKTIRFRVKNHKKQDKWIEKKIVGYSIYKTSEKKERRYKVYLKLRCNDVEKYVLVNLNDRSHLEFPLLLGRNYLRGDFLVDVDINNKDTKPIVAFQPPQDDPKETKPKKKPKKRPAPDDVEVKE